MRAYYFGNMYLSSIQQGIQAAHATHEMFIKYQIESEQKRVLFDWATNYKTMILLNAGYAKEILSLQELFRSEQNSLPWATFYEEGDSLNFAATSTCIVLPETFYDRANWKAVEHWSTTDQVIATGEECMKCFLPLESEEASGVTFSIGHKHPVTQKWTKFNAYEWELAKRITQYRFAI